VAVLTFIQWLKQQRDRDDPVGDLARDAASDRRFPRSNSLVRLQAYLAFDTYAIDLAQIALVRAWAEWQGADPATARELGEMYGLDLDHAEERIRVALAGEKVVA
jgi:hypothetical protein